VKLIFSSVFESDFAELVGYFQEQAGGSVSSRFENAVCRLLELLVRNPKLGRLRPDLKPDGIRSFVVPGFRNHVIFYRVAGQELCLLRIRFGGMDLPAIFHS